MRRLGEFLNLDTVFFFRNESVVSPVYEKCLCLLEMVEVVFASTKEKVKFLEKGESIVAAKLEQVWSKRSDSASLAT